MATAANTTAVAASAACVVAGARESAVRLLTLLQGMGADPGRQKLAEQIIRCIDRALAAVRGGAGDDKKRRPTHGPTARPPAGSSKRRVTGHGETRARVVSSTTDDSFVWRKYGDKIINNHRYRRFYFRCTYRDEHGCGAKKQVQQTQEDPSLFQTTYFGKHTPACPRDAPVDVVGGTFVPHVSFLTSSSTGAAGDKLCPDNEARKVPSLPAEKELMLPNVAEFTQVYCPGDDQLMNLVSADVSFASPAGELESLDGSLEEHISLFWS